MCGGRGTRLECPGEKPLFEVGGVPMIERVRRALRASDTQTTHAAVSPHTPETAAFLADRPVSVIETPGEGYVADLVWALERLGRPVLTVAADLALLSETVIDSVLAEARQRSPSSIVMCVPTTLKTELGLSYEHPREHEGQTVVPTGVNVVSTAPERTVVSADPRLAVNVNTLEDAAVAEGLL